MSAPHPRFQDNTPSLKRVLAAFAPPEQRHAEQAIEFLREESEVMPTVSDQRTRTDDTRPPTERFDKRSPEANRLDLLEEHAVILRRITWSQMTEYCTGTGSDPKKVHDWSSK